MTRRRAYALCLCLAVAIPATGQRFTHLSGNILDPSEAGIPRAAISIVHEETGFRRGTESASDGSYSITSLQSGQYRVMVRKEGFRTVIRFGVRLDAGQGARLDLTLPVGSIEDTITVRGETPLVGGGDASVATSIPRQEIEKLPLNGRGVLGLAELAPGAIATPATRGEPGQFTVNGQRPNANHFSVDGVSANSGVSGGGVPAQATGGALPGLSAFGSTDPLLGVESMQEFRIQTSTTPSDFGRLPGASVVLTSRSGTGEFHGSAAYRFRHEWLSANDWFANQSGVARAPLRLHHLSPALGGPIRRNRTFFFLAYDGVRLRQPYAWRSPVPSAQARADAAEWVRPILNLFPLPNGPSLGALLAEWTGRNRQPAGLDAGNVRVDHALTSRIALFGRYQDTPSSNEFGNTQINRLDLRSRSLILGANVRPTANLAFDARLNAADARADSFWSQRGADPCAIDAAVSSILRNPGPCDDFVRFAIAGVGQLVSGPEGTRSQTQYQAIGSAAVNFGRHSLRIGVDWRRLGPRRSDPVGTLGVLAENIEDLTDTRYLWTGAAAAQRGSIVVQERSLWVHDTVQVTPRLTVNGGLRWEDSPSPMPRSPVYFLDLELGTVGLDTRPLWPRRYGNVAPRAGLAWRADKDGRTVIRGGAGWYFDSSLSIATDSINSGTLSVSQYSSSRYAPFPSLLGYGFHPDLRLPEVAQWSLLVDRAIDAHDTVSLGYVGSAGHLLLRREMGGRGSSPTVWMTLATNHGSSVYHGLQVQFRRNLARGVQANAAYTWSHSIDNSSSDSMLYWAGSGAAPRADRASSDFDLRHSLSAGFTVSAWRGWSLDGILRARTGFPLTVLSADQYNGVVLANALRPDLVAGQPLWLDDPAAAGGTKLNPKAFRPAAEGVQGSLGRNWISGFGMWQIDLAVRREFKLGERGRLLVRAEAFNALNRASFADPVRNLNSPLFGQPTSMLNLMLGTGSPGSGLAPIFQTGAPRSLEIGIRLGF
jgi:hypothetical protein